jgi:hypothetical protein
VWELLGFRFATNGYSNSSVFSTTSPYPRCSPSNWVYKSSPQAMCQSTSFLLRNWLLFFCFSSTIIQGQRVFISEYLEGTSTAQKAIEIYNPSCIRITALTAYTLKVAYNGGAWSTVYTFAGSLSMRDSLLLILTVAVVVVFSFLLPDYHLALLSYPSISSFSDPRTAYVACNVG